MWITEYPASARREGQGRLLRPGAHRHGGRARRALPEVPAPGLPGAELRHLAVVRVPVPRLAVQPGRREEGWPGAARHGPLRDRGRRRRRSPSTPARSSRARRSAPTPPARRPKAPTASAEVATDGASCHRRARRCCADVRSGPIGHRLVIAVLLIVGFVVAVVINMRRGRGRGRLRDRARRQPQAVPRRRGARDARSSTARSASASCLLGRHRRRAARCTGWPSRPARPAPSRGSRRPSIRQGEDDLRRRRPTAPSATAPRASAACGHLAAQRQRRVRRPGQLAGAGAQHRAVPLHPRRGASTSSTTAAATRRCRPGARPVAVRSPSSSSTTSSTTSRASSCRPSEAQAELAGGDREGVQARRRRPLHRRRPGQPERRGHVRRPSARRCSTWACTTASPAAPTPAAAATPRAGPTASPRSPAAARSARTSPAAPTLRQFDDRRGRRSRSCRRAPSRASRYGNGRHRLAARCPASASTRTPSSEAAEPSMTRPGHVHPGPDRRRRRLRAEPVMRCRHLILFAGLAWDPAIRGILVVARRRRRS